MWKFLLKIVSQQKQQIQMSEISENTYNKIEITQDLECIAK